MEPTVSAWTDLGGGIRVRRSRLFEMNSVLLLDRGHTVLVDPGVLPAELDDLAREVRDARARSVTLVLTHAHWDHVLGRPWFPDARALAHDRFEAELRRDLDHIRAESAKHAAEHGASYARPFAPFAPDEAVSGLRFVKLDPWRLVVRDAAGHCSSQISVHLPEQRVLIAADMLSDIEIPALDGPCAVYLATLRKLEPVFRAGAVETLIPGHGTIARDAAAAARRLSQDLDYLETLERGVRDARDAGLGVEATVQELAASHGGRPIEDAYNLEMHRENVRLTWAALAHPAPAAPARRGPGGKYRTRK
jgi:hydroxyacylglutathione hydrolase